MNIHPLFEAKEKLERTLVNHTRFVEVRDQLKNSLLFPTDAKLTFVLGPSGVGKSRLYQVLQKVIVDMMTTSLIEDRERIPYVAFEVPSVQIGNFSWKNFYSLYLEQLRLPVIPASKSLQELPNFSASNGLDHVLMKTIEHRRPIATLLDEANHLTQVTSGNLFKQQLEKIKSLANRSGVHHICFGTYDLAGLINLSGQLARRCKIIHFGRYTAESEEDKSSFRSLIRGYQASVPVAHHLDLRTRAKFLYERTIGCPGTLKTWIMEALSHAYANKREAITMEDLEATAMPIAKLNTMLADARQGEELFREELADVNHYTNSLYTKDSKSDELDLRIEPNANKGNKPAGERQPKRDPVGGAFEGNDVAA